MMNAFALHVVRDVEMIRLMVHEALFLQKRCLDFGIVLLM